MCRLIKCSWYYSWLTHICSPLTPSPSSIFICPCRSAACGEVTWVREDINAFRHHGPNNESHSLGFGLSLMHLWQFLESQWFGLASVPSSVSFGCFLNNVSWLESLLSWGSSRKDSETSEWRYVSAVFPIVVKNAWQKPRKEMFALAHSSRMHSPAWWEGLKPTGHIMSTSTVRSRGRWILVLNSLYPF